MPAIGALVLWHRMGYFPEESRDYISALKPNANAPEEDDALWPCADQAAGAHF